MNDTLKWIVLSSERSAGKAALDALALEYKKVPDSDPRFMTPAAQALIKSLENPPVDGVYTVCYPDPDYPAGLKALSSPPAVLYVRGSVAALSEGVSAAVVGSRSASAYGLSVTMDFCRDFCEMGMTIISGGARGVDSTAAETALKFGGKTVAVLGCGLDVVYPPENQQLFEKIVSSGGAIVSEYHFGTTPVPANFPRRNRIIAALADCCVVTEAGLKSGSLITANLASDLRKPLFAVPGNINSRGSIGTNHLIKTGASLAVSGMQVAAELKVLLSFSQEHGEKKPRFTRVPLSKQSAPGPDTLTVSDETPTAAPKPKGTTKPQRADLTNSERAIISAIKGGNTSAAGIAAAAGIDEATLAPELIMMEIKGLISKEYNGYRVM